MHRPQAIEPLSEGHRRTCGSRTTTRRTRPSWPGPRTGSKAAAEKLQAAGIRSQRIPVACGFHSPLIAGAKEPLADALGEAKFAAPRKPVYSNTTAAPHAADPAGHRAATGRAPRLAGAVRGRDRGDVRGRCAGVRGSRPAGGADRARRADPRGPAAPGGRLGRESRGRVWCNWLTCSGSCSRPACRRISTGCSRVAACRRSTWRNSDPDTGKPKPPPTAWVVNGVRSRPHQRPRTALAGPGAARPTGRAD